MEIARRTQPGWQRTLYIIFFVQLVTAVGFSSIFPFLPLYVAELGTNTTLSVELLAGLVYSAQAFTMMLAGLLYIPQSFVSEAWQLLVLMALVGVAMGGVIPSVSALLTRYSRPGAEGAVFGLDNSVRAGARAMAPLLGAAAALALGIRATFVVTGVVFVAGAALAAWRLPEPQRERMEA